MASSSNVALLSTSTSVARRPSCFSGSLDCLGFLVLLTALFVDGLSEILAGTLQQFGQAGVGPVWMIFVLLSEVILICGISLKSITDIFWGGYSKSFTGLVRP